MLPFPINDIARQTVIVGQSGSGKTGLLIGLLEELALLGLPVIAIDPKGDLTNTCLVFPRMQTEDFAALLPHPDPNLADRLRAGMLADGINDLHAWHDRVVVRILTPGSDAAPVDVVSALTTCPPDLDDEGRTLWISGAVSALLGLVGLDGDPLKDPGALLLTCLYEDAFSAGESLPFDVLIPRILRPPFERLATLPLDQAFPPKAREQLAVRLNHLVAAPSFAAWRTGVPLDPGAWLTKTDGRTPITVLTLNHLPDEQRTFFLTLFLHAVIAWKRRQSGTTAPRAVIAFDEAATYMPPHPANPPTKAPMVTLYRQGRAYGVGMIVATQHPVDLDYRVLSNAGLWFVGRLQTHNDRARVLEGMGEGRHAEVLQALAPREFLLRDTSGAVRRHRARHTRSWLRGPLTLSEIRRITAGWTPARAATPWPTLPADRTSGPPPMPTGLRAAWLPTYDPSLVPEGEDLPDWIPAIYAKITAAVRDGDDQVTRVRHRLWLDPAARPLARELPDLTESPQRGSHALLPPAIDTAPELSDWEEAVRVAVAEKIVVYRYVGDGADGGLGEPEAEVAARFPGVPLQPKLCRPRRGDVRVAWFGVVWIPTRQP